MEDKIEQLRKIAQTPEGFAKLSSMMAFSVLRALTLGLFFGIIFGGIMGYLFALNMP